jgi:hypothetical protein
MALSAAVGILVSIANLRKPFPLPGHLMGRHDFTTLSDLLKYTFNLISIFLFNVPLLYIGVAKTLNFSDTATSVTLAVASSAFGVVGWGLYTFKNWARLLMFTISVFAFFPILASFPPFFFDRFSDTTALLPFIAPYGLMVFYFRREDVRQLLVLRGCGLSLLTRFAFRSGADHG